jgi:hypothetical protein
LALTLETSDSGFVAGWKDSNALFSINAFSDSIQFRVDDNSGNTLAESTTTNPTDGTPHVIVCNKTSNSNMDIWVDQVKDSDEESSPDFEQGFDHTNATRNATPTFFASNVNGTIQNYNAQDIGVLEINAQPYTQTEREAFKSYFFTN